MMKKYLALALIAPLLVSCSSSTKKGAEYNEAWVKDTNGFDILMGQFAHQPKGQHAKETFRRGFLHGLHKVQMVYPKAKVEPFDGGLALHASPPPVAKLKGGSNE